MNKIGGKSTNFTKKIFVKALHDHEESWLGKNDAKNRHVI